ncbi:MAG: P1 family peptidase [Actinomycetota bacterium]|nr:P1 family peptidase [Actinomycetota bacterium]
MSFAFPGVPVGHWSDPVARTGCTVILLPDGVVASGEVRGGAPGTREWALLSPTCTVDRVDAVVLTGGSAFGLAACDGVVRWCEEHGAGYPTPAGRVPIVVGMVLYDLGVGDPSVRPGPAEGYHAAAAAVAVGGASARGGGGNGTGLVGAGTGATVGKWGGADSTRPGGLGAATRTVATAGERPLMVAALVAVNAVGDLRGAPDPPVRQGQVGPLQATTIGIVVTNAVADKSGCLLLAQSAHDGLARAIEPVHTSVDGDAFVAAATGVVPAPLDLVRSLAAAAVEAAILDAIGPPSS